MASTPTATVNALDPDGRPLDSGNPATDEDPIDDLVTSLRNACRWSVCRPTVLTALLTRSQRARSQEPMGPIGPEGTFWPFAALAPELRLMIWEECIPRRIHLIAEPVHGNYMVEQAGNHPLGRYYILAPYPYHNSHCSRFYPLTFRNKIPSISKVNFEAAKLARSHKVNSMCYNLAFVYFFGGLLLGRVRESPVWLDKKKDTVLINTPYITPAAHPADSVLQTEDGRLDFKADRLFGMVTRNQIQVAMFAAVLIDRKVPVGFYHALTEADRVDLVAGVFRFDGMPDDEAVDTELFGLFGEESMGLISANNIQSLQKLFKADKTFHPKFGVEYFELRHHAQLDLCMPGGYRQWEFPSRPSDFNAYCEQMQAVASATMDLCERYLMERLFQDEWNNWYKDREWQRKVEATFRNKFAPVFLVHRCHKNVLLGSQIS